MTKKAKMRNSAVVSGIAVLASLYVGYDKMAVNNAGPNAETMGTIALVAAAVFFFLTIFYAKAAAKAPATE